MKKKKDFQTNNPIFERRIVKMRKSNGIGVWSQTFEVKPGLFFLRLTIFILSSQPPIYDEFNRFGQIFHNLSKSWKFLSLAWQLHNADIYRIMNYE